MSKWTKLRDKLLDKLFAWLGIDDVLATAEPLPATCADLEQVGRAADSELLLACCWDGENAERRMMNMLSPKFSDSKFAEYANWMTARGCNTAHLILANEGDGEGAGYWAHDYPAQSRERIAYFKARGFKIVVWLVTDDSKNYLKTIFADPARYVNAVADAGLLADAALVVLGLEMDEGGSRAQWQALRDALRTRYSGPIGTHHTSSNYSFIDLGEYVCDQLDPKVATEATVKKSVRNLLAKGKKVVGFEYARNPNRKLAQAAIDAGAIGVGNWDGEAAPATAKDDLAVGDEVSFSDLDFCWGGFKPSKSAKIKSTIATLRVSSDKMSFGWVNGGCEDLGASDKSDYSNTLACLFCRIGGKWKGGKFDWISTSRTTRDFKNIKSGYNGWDKSALDKADKYAFCVVCKDGQSRTNIITC